VEPYTIFGDVPTGPYFPGYVPYDANIAGRDFPVGEYSIKADYYSRDNARGKRIDSLTVSFTVIDCGEGARRERKMLDSDLLNPKRNLFRDHDN
jgi:hypothetical protein